MTILDLIQFALASCLGLLGIVSVGQIIFKLKKFYPREVDTRYVDLDEAPSISVCIPVRNEDHAIQDCLERVLANNYPKMEVIVLDDESVDQTPEIVKIFARNGVRFIKGETLPSGWIGKNKAMDQLARQANGKYILFLSADVDLKPDSISRLVSFALKHRVEMLGIMPIREDHWRLSTILGTLRQFWTLLFDRPQAPAYMTTAWLVDRQALNHLGGFEKYRLSISPERELAQEFARRQAYHFLVSSPDLGFNYQKRWRSQIETSVRTLWPLSQRNFFWPPFFLSLLLVSWLLLGLVAFKQSWSVATWSLVIANFWPVLSFFLCSLRIHRRSAWLNFVTWPLQVIQESIALILSYFKHRFNTLVWKGRRLTDHID